jgi:hypothetical protein
MVGADLFQCTRALFDWLVFAGAQVGDQVVELSWLKDVAEGRHHFAPIRHLGANRLFALGSSHAGEIRAPVAADISDRMAVLASARGKVGRSMHALSL